MNSLRITPAVLLLSFLTATGLSGQTRIALTGGATSWVEESCRWYRVSEDALRAWEYPPNCVELSGRTSRSFGGLSAGLSGIVPLPGAFEVEVGAAYSRHKRWHLGSQMSLMALGRVNFQQWHDAVRWTLMAGPTLAREICPSEESFPGNADECATNRSNIGLALGVGLEFGLAEDLGFTLGTLYNHGMRNLDRSPVLGEYVRQRAAVIRAGLVRRIG